MTEWSAARAGPSPKRFLRDQRAVMRAHWRRRLGADMVPDHVTSGVHAHDAGLEILIDDDGAVGIEVHARLLKASPVGVGPAPGRNQQTRRGHGELSVGACFVYGNAISVQMHSGCGRPKPQVQALSGGKTKSEYP